MFTSVVLPAPLGPIRPQISPSATSSDTPSTARTPPKWRRTSNSRRRGFGTEPSMGPAGGAAKGDPAPDDPLGAEDDHQDEDDPGDHVAVARRRSDDLGQRGDEDGAHEGAQHGGDAPDHHEHETQDGPVEAVLGGVDEEVEVGLEGAGVAGQNGAEHEGTHLVAGYGDGVAGGGQLVLANGRPRLAHPAGGEPP